MIVADDKVIGQCGLFRQDLVSRTAELVCLCSGLKGVLAGEGTKQSFVALARFA